MEAVDEKSGDPCGMRWKAVSNQHEVSFPMVRIVAQILLLALVYGSQSLWHKNAIAQDFATLLDIARANGESLQNYDVSYRRSTVANLPKDQERLVAIKKSFESQKMLLWEENEEIGRLVIDKESTNNPKKILFVRRKRISFEGMVKQHTEFMAWEDGKIATGTTSNPSGEIGRGKSTLAKCYRYSWIPSFETYHGTLVAPQIEGYWDDHSVYWEWYKSHGADLPIIRLPNGSLRLERTFETHRSISEYDPITSLIVFFTSIPINQETGNEKLEFATPVRVTWENHQNVYRLKGVVARGMDNGIMTDGVEAFHWHQCNEETFKFPGEFLIDLSLDKCTQFLIDGQSELSTGR